MPNYRNPNGYGSVVKLSGRRRRPFMVRKTVGYDDRAYPIYDIIGYYATRAEAMMALAEYNRDPYDVDMAKSTMREVYEAWSEETYPRLQMNMKKAYQAAYKHCATVYDKPYKSLRKGHMQACIDFCGKGYSTRSNIKMLFTQLDKYAYDHDIINKCYADNLTIGNRTVSDKHTLVTDSEVQMLWNHQGEPCVDETLFLLYTGFRMSEMLTMKNEDVDFEENTMTGGLKTAAGKNRIVPIHPDLLPIVKRHYSDKTYLFDLHPKQDTETYRTTYLKQWKKKMEELGFNHFTHDCRHTVRSKLDSAGANAVAIDRIMGHTSKTIGERIYTHKTVKDLQDAINLLSYNCVTVSNK